MLRRWGSETRKFGLSTELITLETSAFQSLYGGQFTLSTPLINTKFTYIESFLTIFGQCINVLNYNFGWRAHLREKRCVTAWDKSIKKLCVNCKIVC